MKDIYFMPLGGGQEVGASCYYLRLGKQNIILDAGVGKNNRTPTTYSLLKYSEPTFVECMNQIDQLYISHAHMDHIGYLSELLEETNDSSLYMTEITFLLSKYQLFQKECFAENNMDNIDKKLYSKYHLEKKTTIVDYNQQINFKTHKVTFLSAGHIPGAMMTLFEYKGKRILYTGDYSLKETLLTSNCIIPDNLKIDIVILCGVHAKHSQYLEKKNKLYKEVDDVLKSVKESSMSVLCYVPQLSKGIEFLKALNRYNHTIPVYMDKSVSNVVKEMEKLHISLCKSNNKEIENSFPKEPHIFITADSKYKKDKMYTIKNIKFSLHDDFNTIKEFIIKINPQKVIVVHTTEKYSPNDKTIEEEMQNSNIEFIFAENNTMYQL